MATKYRNTNIFIRILLVILSVVFFAGAYFNAVELFNYSKAYNLEEVINNDNYIVNENTPISESNHLEAFLGSDVHSADIMLLAKDTEYCKKELEASREKNVNSIINDYDETNGERGEPYTNSFDISIGGVSVWLSLETPNEKAQIVYGDSVETVKAKANLRYTEYIENGEYIKSLQNVVEDQSGIHGDFYYYVKNNKAKTYVTNFSNEAELNNVLNHEYAFVFKDGKIQTSDKFKGLFSESEVNKDIFKNDEYYVYIDETNSNTDSIISYIHFAEKERSVNPKQLLISFFIMLALAGISALLYFILCGTKDENGKVKRIFIDYIPSDLHLLISGGLFAGLVLLWARVAEESLVSHALVFSRIYGISSLLIVSLAYLLVIEFISSVVRVCKSEKPIYKNNLFYPLVFKPLRFVFKTLKEAVSFKPENFKKPLTNSLVIYAIINFSFFWAIVLSVFGGSTGFAGAAGILALMFNFGAGVYAIWYIIRLDKIITAAHYRQTPQVNYQKLPQSLKCLASSVSYTKQELENAVNKAVRDERMRTQLITNVSHDLKTPLTSIITYVDLLKSCDIQDENAREYISVLDEKGSRLKKLIDDLVEASKITSGVINLNPVNLSLTELGAQAVYERQQEFAENGLDLVFSDKGANTGAFADGNKTYRILENLLSNARKYSAVGSRVYCSVYETQNYSIFEIKNISAEPLNISAQELKERFVRGDESRNKEGNGLGLSIADNLCKAQGGHLNLTIDGDLFKAQVMLPKPKS